MKREISMRGKRVLVVGGSSGMGLATSALLLQQGASVIMAGRSADRLRNAHMELGADDRLITAALDIADEDAVAALFHDLVSLDHIVCTAASIQGAYQLLPDLDLAAARRVIDSKLIGPILLAKYGTPRLTLGGSITFVSGIAAYRPAARGTVVAAVNAALEGLVRALAVELAPLRINAVSPGWVDTPIWKQVAGDQKSSVLTAMAERLPAGRIGAPSDIADAICFLAGNPFTTGTVLHVDGGHRLI